MGIFSVLTLIIAILSVKLMRLKKTESRIESINKLMERLLKSGSLNEKLQLISDGIVEIFHADFCRIWITKAGDLCELDCIHAKVVEGPHACLHRDRCLHLISSSGRYSNIEGEHKRVPFGCYKIGRIAAEEAAKLITNDVTRHPLIHNHEWAKKLGLVSFAGHRLLSASGKPIGVLALFSKHKISPNDVILLEGLANTTAQVIQTVTAEEELKKSREQLRRLAISIQTVREEERKMIARDFHDDMGQALTVLRFDLAWIDKRLTEDQKNLSDKIIMASELVLKTVKTVQRVSSDLRPTLLDDLGIIAAIEWQAEEFQNRTGIKCGLTVEPSEIILDDKLSIEIFRIFQEALTNVARHADATKVKVVLKDSDGKLVLKIKDNGRGITEKEITDPQSIGIIGIKERIYPWDGKIAISGIQGEGTTITVTIPLEREI